MRRFIALAAAAAAMAGYPALAEDRSRQNSPNHAPPFAEDGIYIPAGATVEVALAGKCRALTNHDKRIGLFFSPSMPGSWPREAPTEPMEPKVTEEPCK